MNKLKALLWTGTMLLIIGDALAQTQPQTPPEMQTQLQAQPSTRIRGAITKFDGQVLQVKTREGKMVQLTVPDETKVSVLSRLKMSNIKQGSFVGVTAVLRGPGATLEALEVHVFPESMRGTGEGHHEWDLQPGSTMTNANVDAIVSTARGEELTLSYKGGSQKIVVPRNVPVITFTPADKALLKARAQVFIIAHHAPDGSLSAQRILVGKDGMKPPM